PIRPYALRVGAGARLDESLSSALRNYVMSHSGAVFENDYQTGVVRANLHGLAFGPNAVRRDEELFSNLRNMTLTWDEGAPISVSKEQVAKFRERKDIAEFRARIQASTDSSERKKLHSQINSSIETCTRPQLEADRQAYFKEADPLRLQGIEPEPTPGAGGPGRAAPVADLLARLCLRDEHKSLTVDKSVSERYINAQLQDLSSITASVPRQVSKTAAASEAQRDSCCFVCSKGFTNRSSLTRHFRKTHLVDGTFDGPLACRECKRTGAAEVVFHGPAEWCNHLEHTHGLIHTPRLNPGASPLDCPSNSPLSCLLCEAPMTSASTLRTHMNRTEIPRYREEDLRACGVCTREGRVGVKPMSIWEWLTHARGIHRWSLPDAEPSLICGHLCNPGRGLQRHFTTQHSGERYSSGQAATNAAGRKRKSDGDMDSECTATAAVRKAAAKHNLLYKEEPSPLMASDTDSDLCHDVIICASTVDEQQTCYPTENRTGLSAILDSDFLGQVEPALLAL
ncbi:hypothetical protein C8A03DRAFT_34023, partial [Achaetomium macrosporum]